MPFTQHQQQLNDKKKVKDSSSSKHYIINYKQTSKQSLEMKAPTETEIKSKSCIKNAIIILKYPFSVIIEKVLSHQNK